MPMRRLDALDEIIQPILDAGRIPGAAVAVVADGRAVFARGYGYRDLHTKQPVTSRTVYPIASTTKAMNATLLGMLIDDGVLAWDAPVQMYLPRFRLADVFSSSLITLRDLLTMRTGLPRHDFLWMESGVSRAELVERVQHLPLSAGLRERFQYCNLTATLAGHVAEVVAQESWEDLIRRRLLQPLGMSNTGFASPYAGEVTSSYHENQRRELVLTRRFATEPIGPAGGAIHSTIMDMAQWLIFNLEGGRFAGRQLIAPGTLDEIHTPCVLAGADSSAPSPGATYALGWFVDTYQGRTRLSHTGYLHDVQGCVTLFPQARIGVVSFVNFASSRLAALINQYVIDGLLELEHGQTVEDKLARYEQNIDLAQRRNAGVHRAQDTAPSHPLGAYAGSYVHRGYGRIVILQSGTSLVLQRNALLLPLEHWHYDAWVVADNELFEIHTQHPFERANPVQFETGPDGDIVAFSMRLDPTVPAARFEKEQAGWV